MSEPDDVVVNDFLQKIKSMGEQRDQDTEQRSRQLEEEILKGRKERQARRAGTRISPVFANIEAASSVSSDVLDFPNILAHRTRLTFNVQNVQDQYRPRSPPQ